MPPKLGAEQIDNKLVEIRDYVRDHHLDFAGRGSASLKLAFTPKQDGTGFYQFLHRSEERFSEAQQRYADDTFALLTQNR